MSHQTEGCINMAEQVAAADRLAAVIAEIDDWLGSGGLFNPSEMNMLTTKGHRAVFGWREQLEAVATALQQREAALQALVKEWREERDGLHGGPETRVTYDLCADDLEALIGAPASPLGEPERQT